MCILGYGCDHKAKTLSDVDMHKTLWLFTLPTLQMKCFSRVSCNAQFHPESYTLNDVIGCSLVKSVFFVICVIKRIVDRGTRWCLYKRTHLR